MRDWRPSLTSTARTSVFYPWIWARYSPSRVDCRYLSVRRSAKLTDWSIWRDTEINSAMAGSVGPYGQPLEYKTVCPLIFMVPSSCRSSV